MWYPRLSGADDQGSVVYPFPVDEARSNPGRGAWARKTELPRSSGRSAARHPAEIALDRVQNNLDRLSEQVDELAPMRFGDFTSRNDDRDPTPAA